MDQTDPISFGSPYQGRCLSLNGMKISKCTHGEETEGHRSLVISFLKDISPFVGSL